MKPKKHSRATKVKPKVFNAGASKRINSMLESLGFSIELDRVQALFDQADMQLINRDKMHFLAIKGSTLQYMLGIDEVLSYMQLYGFNALLLQIARDGEHLQVTFGYVARDWLRYMQDCYKDFTPSIKRDMLRLHIEFQTRDNATRAKIQNDFREYLLDFNYRVAPEVHLEYNTQEYREVNRFLWDNYASALGAEDAEDVEDT